MIKSPHDWTFGRMTSPRDVTARVVTAHTGPRVRVIARSRDRYVSFQFGRSNLAVEGVGGAGIFPVFGEKRRRDEPSVGNQHPLTTSSSVACDVIRVFFF